MKKKHWHYQPSDPIHPPKKKKEKKLLLLQSIAQDCTIIKDLIKSETIQNANQISARNRKTNLNKYGIFLEVRTTLLIFFSNNIQLWKVLKISKTDLSNSIQIYIFVWLWYWNTSNCSLVCGGCRGMVVIVDSSYIGVVIVDDSCDNGGHGYDCEWYYRMMVLMVVLVAVPRWSCFPWQTVQCRKTQLSPAAASCSS